MIFLLWKSGGDHGRGLGKESERGTFGIAVNIFEFIIESFSNQPQTNVQNETLSMLGSRYKKQGKVWRDPCIDKTLCSCLQVHVPGVTGGKAIDGDRLQSPSCDHSYLSDSSYRSLEIYRFTAWGLVRIEHGSQHALLISHTPGPTRVCLFGGPATCWNLYPEVAWLQLVFQSLLRFRDVDVETIANIRIHFD